MRVATLGYQTWGHRTLQALLQSDHEVVLAITHPKSDHVYEQMWADSVADLATEHGVPVHIATKPDENFKAALKEADPDIVVANNWRTWLPRDVFDSPRYGTLNIHDSLLPKYTGFSPLIWALINGEEEVGLTAHLMDEELDAGDIVLQRSTRVGPTDTVTDLFHRTVDMIGPITLDALALIESGRTDWTPQDRSQATFFHKRAPEDSLIDWTWPADAIERLVRAQSDPYPNAFTHFKGQRVRVLKSAVSEGNYGGTPGRVFIHEGDGMVIVAGPDARTGQNKGLKIQRVRLDDGTELAGTDFFPHGGGYLS
ncbi:methionyl-tRNA formyltransferase [Rhodococcus opacus]|uniref:methionyl-tRNA formyltransferase n=1 Tax=Rhodococcus opacus TaxID=37919 RepID=UPI001C48EC03|nr:methionyl-tRNA formyltransferase [Rhodococcus opacus]MBV6756505.1 methionyl-tRNA formyltransferase [Rhodococcus opacus]